MKVFFITKVPFPHGMAPTKRITCYAKGLSDNGIKSEVLVINRTETSENTLNKSTNGTLAKDATYQYFSGSTYRPKGILQRKYYDIIDLVKVLSYCFRNADKETIIYNYGDDIIIHVLFTVVCLLSGAKHCRELCEYPFHTVEHVGIIRKIKSWITIHGLFKIYDAIIPISAALQELADKHKGMKTKICKIPILVDEENTDVASISVNHPYLFHSGKLDEQKDGFIGMLKAYAMAQQSCPELHFYSTGSLSNSNHKAEAEQIIKEFELHDKVHFLGFVSLQELNAYQKNSTLFIINKLPSFQNMYCFPTKLGEYLLCGRPVITTDYGEANNYLRDEKNALIVHHGDTEGLANAIICLLKDKTKADTIGKNGYVLAKNSFSYKNQGVILASFFKSL